MTLTGRFPRLIAFCFAAIFGLIATTNVGAVNTPQSESFDIRDFGAKGDGKTINTAAIQTAINHCRDHGGGTVLIPAGTYLSGTLRLFSNIHLQVGRGAVLKGSDKISDYQLDGAKLGLIFVQNATNISITGDGTIDGNGDAFFDHTRSLSPNLEKPEARAAEGAFSRSAGGCGRRPAGPLRKAVPDDPVFKLQECHR